MIFNHTPGFVECVLLKDFNEYFVDTHLATPLRDYYFFHRTRAHEV
jgi:hypothetical protein